MNRREFVKRSSLLTGAVLAGAGCAASTSTSSAEPIFRISLAQWSINPSFFEGPLDNLDFAPTAREHGFEAIEYVNQFFKDKAEDMAYLNEMNRIADSEGITNVLIMIDGEGRIGDPDEATRDQAVQNHFKWVEAAAHLNCHAIRVNAHSGSGTWEEQLGWTADGYRQIVEHGDEHGVSVIIENHGGFSSDPRWLVELMETVDHPRAGVLPDTGGFSRGDDDADDAGIFDPYEAVEMLAPYAKGMSIKGTTDLPSGEEVEGDFERFMRIALDSGWRGYAGIEYGRIDGISAAREKLEAARTALTPDFS